MCFSLQEISPVLSNSIIKASLIKAERVFIISGLFVRVCVCVYLCTYVIVCERVHVACVSVCTWHVPLYM